MPTHECQPQHMPHIQAASPEAVFPLGRPPRAAATAALAAVPDSPSSNTQKHASYAHDKPMFKDSFIHAILASAARRAAPAACVLHTLPTRQPPLTPKSHYPWLHVTTKCSQSHQQKARGSSQQPDKHRINKSKRAPQLLTSHLTAWAVRMPPAADPAAAQPQPPAAASHHPAAAAAAARPAASHHPRQCSPQRHLPTPLRQLHP